MLSVEMQAQWETAESTPLGKYPETVTYMLGKIAGANNANLPAGNTYEDNAYTRYLREVLNIQNDDVFELEAGGSYEEALEMAIEDRNIPDVLVVNGRDNLIRLVENDMVEDLTDVYKNCTTKVIKEMYDSYGENVLASATFDGRLYAFPNTEIDDREMLLWLRVEADIAGNGSTVGLACSTNLIAGSSDTYGVDGKCGAVFGRWWAPNNPLSAAYSADNTAVWKPYLFSYENDKKVQVFESYDDSMYVVVRKGFEHPEIVGKYVSALFDYARYGDDQYAD